MQADEKKNQKELLRQSCRVALAAFLHDLGKFAERAKVPVDEEVLAANKQLYCPHRKKYTDDPGWFSHVHAAYTGLALDMIERNFPELIGKDVSPFAGWKCRDADDSFINAAAKHHKPETFIQWIIATADRVASGFDREEFERYNVSEEGTATRKNHYTARQLTLFEQIRLDGGRPQRYRYRYPLKPFAPETIFPVKADACETDDNAKAQREYRELWEQFTSALEKIPDSHRDNWELWLDHFETLWGVFTHAIPSATAFNVRPDVSLYDHSRVTAALATALWRYHSETGNVNTEKLSEQGEAWDEDKLLLIQGDFFGIQDFIFASGGETQKRAAKLLRGRSFYISLLTECAALKILDALSLPSTSQVINAAGKFMIVAPYIDSTLSQLEKVQQELNDWFLRHSYGQAGIGLAWQPACCNDFRHGKAGQPSPYRELIRKLFDQLETIKFQRYQLCENPKTPTVFSEFLDEFNNELGVCKIDGRSPAKKYYDNEVPIGELAYDQIETGHWLTRRQRILITEKKLNLHSSLTLPIFGYYISFAENQEIRGKFGTEAKSGNLRRAWDFSWPKSGEEPLWNGYARRAINAYVPVVDGTMLAEQTLDKYAGVEEALLLDDAKTLNHLACDDRQLQPDGRWSGICALTTLKGDVDNLGAIFQNGLGRSGEDEGRDDISFSKTAALSRQLNAFFAVYLPWLCQAKSEFKNTYTVFAGGDDFFMIGPWLAQIKLAREMRQAFRSYVADNPEVHFSVGLSTSKPGMPIPQLGEMAEAALEQAKSHNPEKTVIAPKNAVTCFNQTMSWQEFETLIDRRKTNLDDYASELKLSTGYIYGLLGLIEMAEKVSEKPENALWHAYFAYRTARMLERQKHLSPEQRKRRQAELAEEIAHLGIEQHGGNYRVALFSHLYQNRD